MTETDKAKLRVKLTEIIEEEFFGYIEQSGDELGLMPLVGENISLIMATAGMQVLVAVDDTQKYLERAGLLKDE